LEQALSVQKEEQQQLQAIQQVGQAIVSSLDLTKVLNMVMDTIVELTGAERGFLMLLDQESGKLIFRVARNMDRETIHRSSFKISRSLVNRVATEGEPIVTTNAQADPRFSAQESVVSYSLRSILCVPLKVHGELVGVIYADNRIVTGLFDDKDRDLLVSFANQAAVAIYNARLFQQVTDQLKAITAMKNLMDNVFASIASGVITTNVDDEITLVNRAAETILGISSLQVEGQHYGQSLPGLRASLTELVRQVRLLDATQSLEVETDLAERGHVNLNLQLSPLKDAQNDTLGIAMVLDDLTEKRRREKTMGHIRRYLPPALVDSLTDIEDLQLGGARRTISILFGDVRGFSTFSEQQGPEMVVDVINSYFTVAADAILLHEGIIDKFMGDSVMALFNTSFLPQDDHALRAVRSALAVQYDLVALREVLGADRQLQMGIGIHTGDAVLGNIGSPDRLDFSAIGDAVNLAKRLQEVTGPGQILMSQATYEQTREWVEVIALEPIRVKGRQALEQVYELTGLR
jgi:PAS domain S-box-containing protein